jgi:hypothetical protein
MSLNLIDAVYASRIEPRLRFLASVLAKYGNDDGQDIYPGPVQLMTATGQEENTIREGLQALVDSGVLVRDGFHGHTRRFRFDLDRLASYEPSVTTRAAWRANHKPSRNGKPSRPTLRHGGGLKDSQPYAMAEGSDAATLRHGGANPPPRRRQPYAMAAPTLRHGGAHKGRKSESQESQKRTGAVAPACADEEKTAEKAEDKTEELLGPAAASPANPAVQLADHRGNGRIPFKVYAAIATQAVTNSLRDDKSDDLSNISEHFKRLCAAQGKPYSASLVQRAVDAALAALEKSKQDFLENLRRYGGVKAMPHAQAYQTPRSCA